MSSSLCNDSIVVAKVDRITDSGIFVTLVEYNNRMAFVSVQEMSQRKVSSLAKHSPTGSICAFRVINVTDGGVDLSRRKIDATVAANAVNNYLNSITKSITSVVAQIPTLVK